MALRIKIRGEKWWKALKTGIEVAGMMEKRYNAKFVVGVAYSRLLVFDFDNELDWEPVVLKLLALMLRSPLIIVRTCNGYHAIYCKPLNTTLIRILKFLAWKLNFGDETHNYLYWRRGYNVIRVTKVCTREFEIVYSWGDCLGSSTLLDNI